jgi:hypothetical protein
MIVLLPSDSKELSKDQELSEEFLGEFAPEVVSLTMDNLRGLAWLISSSRHTSGLLTDLRNARCSDSLKCKKVFFEEIT